VDMWRTSEAVERTSKAGVDIRKMEPGLWSPSPLVRMSLSVIINHLSVQGEESSRLPYVVTVTKVLTIYLS
jgi:hypothetical protein